MNACLLLFAASASTTSPIWVQLTAHTAPRETMSVSVVIDQNTGEILGGSGAWYVFDAPTVGYHFHEEPDGVHFLEGSIDVAARQFDIRGVGSWNELAYSELPFHFRHDGVEVTHPSLGALTRSVDSIILLTYPTGDSNLDGRFDSSDIINVFRAGKFESDEKALWHYGDWNGSTYFDSADLVTAFQAGTYGAEAVPEPIMAAWILCIFTLMRGAKRRR